MQSPCLMARTVVALLLATFAVLTVKDTDHKQYVRVWVAVAVLADANNCSHGMCTRLQRGVGAQLDVEVARWHVVSRCLLMAVSHTSRLRPVRKYSVKSARMY